MMLNDENVIISGEIVIEGVSHIVKNKFVKCNSHLNSKSWNTTESLNRCPDCFIGEKFRYPDPKNKNIFTLKSFDDNKYIFECGHYVTNYVFNDLQLIEQYSINKSYTMKLKKTKTFSVSKNTDAVTLEGIEYPIANLLKSGIVNQTIVLLGHDELWHEIDVLNLGGDNSDLTNFKNFVELANLKLSDLIPLKKPEPKNYDVTHDDHVALSEEFPQFDYIKIGKLCSYYGKKSSVYVLRQDLRICTERNLTIEQWIEQMENLNKKTMDNINRSRDRIIQLGKIGFKQNAKKEFEFDGFIVTQNSVDNDTDEVWNSFLSMVPTPTPTPTNQIDIETVINQETTTNEPQPAPAPAEPLPAKKPVSLQTIGSLTPDRITDLSGLTEQQHEIVKQNPFIAVTDKKSLETAKKQRAVLLKASTAIDGTSGIQATAKKYLNTFKTTLDNFLSSTAKITREAYDKQNAEIVKYENAEALRIAEEQRLKVEKINGRTNRLFNVPMVFNGTVYQIGTLYILPSQIENATDDEFELLFNQAVSIKNALDAAAEIEKNKDAEIAELQRKLAQLTGATVETPVEMAVINKPTNNGPTETTIANYTPAPVSETPASQTAAPATNKRFKASTDYFMPTPENTILNRFDLDHVELIQAEPINPAFIKCRAYFVEGNRKVAEQIQSILDDTDVTVKKSVRITQLCEILLNQPC